MRAPHAGPSSSLNRSLRISQAPGFSGNSRIGVGHGLHPGNKRSHPPFSLVLCVVCAALGAPVVVGERRGRKGGKGHCGDLRAEWKNTAATVIWSVLKALRVCTLRIRDLYTRVARWISRRCTSLNSRPPFFVGEAPRCIIHGNNTSSAFVVSLGSFWLPSDALVGHRSA